MDGKTLTEREKLIYNIALQDALAIVREWVKPHSHDVLEGINEEVKKLRFKLTGE